MIEEKYAKVVYFTKEHQFDYADGEFTDHLSDACLDPVGMEDKDIIYCFDEVYEDQIQILTVHIKFEIEGI